MPYYEIRYVRSYGPLTDYVRIKFGTHTPEIAAKSRELSGDLVVEIENGKPVRVCQEDFWLFDWEKKDSKCYARKMQRMYQ